MNIFLRLGFLMFILVLTACQKEGSQQTTGQTTVDNSKPMFELLAPGVTGVQFNNTVVNSNNRNYFFDEYMYNGAGVGVGDFDNDGSEDIFFAGNQAGNKLYFNKGDFKFEDVTNEAGVAATNGWNNGVAIADVNGDGWLDIYVCRGNTQETDANLRKNLLFINQKNGKFEESAAQYGLDDTGLSLNAAFFDYDVDGDLDMIVTNYPPKFDLTIRDVLEGGNYQNQDHLDHLYRNNGDGSFTEVSKEMGVNGYGHGLGLAVSDINKDGYPDIFIANDYVTEDFLYINNAGKGFEQKVQNQMKHGSLFSMGCDVADINNDLLPDIAVADMNPEDNYRSKAAMPSMDPDAYYNSVAAGIHSQFMRNALHLNSDAGLFAEIGQMAGISKTDWSWTMLFGDMDNDGLQDLLVTNGLIKDVDDKDMNKKLVKIQQESGGKLIWDQIEGHIKETPLQNYIYKNQNGFQFYNASNDWNLKETAFSYGAAMADFDGDGDLDVVMNNSNGPAFIYRNNARQKVDNNYVAFKLEGSSKNPFGRGAKVVVKAGNQSFYREVYPDRGYFSTSSHDVHIGLGSIQQIDEVRVTWPGGNEQVLQSQAVNKKYVLKESDATQKTSNPADPKPKFINVGEYTGLNFRHRENEYDDYQKQVLLPHRMSRFGPALAVGDVNGDGLQDVFLGGAHQQASALYIQGAQAKFALAPAQPWSGESDKEDVSAAFLDIDGDNDLDLYIGSGGFEWPEGNARYKDRFYLNDGKGNFSAANNLIPNVNTSTGIVKPFDYDRDGDIDLIVGGRVVPDKYPYAPKSYLLRNDGGRLVDVTKTVFPDLENLGMIADALWTDINNDGRVEVMLVGDWTPINLFSFDGNKFMEMTSDQNLAHLTGWWNCISHGDLDGDGDLDYVVGNLGLNYKYQASASEPFDVYCDDFDDNGTYDIVLGYYQKGVQYPVRGLQCSSDQMPFVKKEFPTYTEFASSSLSDIYGDRLNEALHHKVETFESMILWNDGGSFRSEPLPLIAQTAPVQAISVFDFNKDGNADILLCGNLMVSEVETGHADAGFGTYFLGNGQGDFIPMSPKQSGFVAPFDVRNMELFNLNTRFPMVIVANNDQSVQIFGF